MVMRWETIVAVLRVVKWDMQKVSESVEYWDDLTVAK